MYWKKAPRTVWSGLTQTWNRYHRLRVGVVLLALWYAVFIIDNPTPAAITSSDQWAVGIAFFVLLTIGVTLILDSLIRVIANWRTTPLTNPETWGESDNIPDPAPTLSKNGYTPHRPAEGSAFEFTGRASVSCFPLTALGWFGVFAIMLLRESFPTTPELSLLANLALAGAIVVGMVAVHEGLHAIVAAAYGAEVSFTFNLAGPATIYEDTVLSRRGLILLTAAPFFVITPIAVGLALSGSWLLMAIGVLVLLIHTGMAGGDLFQVMQWLSEPPGTKFYPSSEVGMISYRPVAADSTTSALSRVDSALARLTAPLKVP